MSAQEARKQNSYVRVLYCRNCNVIAKDALDRSNVIVVVPEGVVEIEVPVQLGADPTDTFANHVKVRAGSCTIPITELDRSIEDADIVLTRPARAIVYRAKGNGDDLCVLLTSDEVAGFCVPLPKVEALRKLYSSYKLPPGSRAETQ